LFLSELVHHETIDSPFLGGIVLLCKACFSNKLTTFSTWKVDSALNQIKRYPRPFGFTGESGCSFLVEEWRRNWDCYLN